MKFREGFDLLAVAPDGVERLRELILSLSIQGKLVRQKSEDKPAAEFLKGVRANQEALVSDGTIRKSLLLAPMTDDDSACEMPAGWTLCRIGDLIYSIKSGGTPSKHNPSFWEGDIPWASVKDLGFGTPVWDTKDKITPAGLDAGSTLAPAGSLLICTRMGLGKIGEAMVDVAINQDLKAITLPHEVDKQYFINYYKTLRIAGAGMTVAGIKQEQLLDFKVPLPPVAEQKRIVAKVGELMQLCDELESNGRLESEHHKRLIVSLFDALAASESAHALAENWSRVAAHFDLLLDRPEAVDTLEQTILQLAMRGLLLPTGDTKISPWSGENSVQDAAEQSIENNARFDPPYEIPSYWAWIRFGDVIGELRYGTSVKCDYEIDGTPVLRIPNLKDGAVTIDDLKFGPLSPEDADRLALVPGDLLIVRSNGSATLVGSAALVEEDARGFAFAGYLMRARLREDLALPKYVLLALATKSVRAQIEGPIRTTSGVKNINSTEVSRLAFPLPPLSIQSHIVESVEALRRVCAKLRVRLNDRQACQAHFATALVQQAAAADPEESRLELAA